MNDATLLNYQEYGKGPTVVLLHDVLMGPDNFSALIADLANADFRVVVPDFSKQSVADDLNGISRAVIALIDRLGIGRAAFCGVGMGGSLLLALLESYQQRIVAASFVNTRAGLDDVQEKFKRAEIISSLAQGDEMNARAELLTMLFGGREKYLTIAERQSVKKAVFSCDQDALIGNLMALQTRKDYSLLLAQLSLPTQVIYGRHDLICHPGYAQLMTGQLPNCVKERGFDGGHLLHIEQSDQVSAELLDFLQTIVPKRHRFRNMYSLMAA